MLKFSYLQIIKSNFSMEQSQPWCCFGFSTLNQEKQQERDSQQYLAQQLDLTPRHKNERTANRNVYSPKKIFSFRNGQCRERVSQEPVPYIVSVPHSTGPQRNLNLSKSSPKQLGQDFKSPMLSRVVVNPPQKFFSPKPVFTYHTSNTPLPPVPLASPALQVNINPQHDTRTRLVSTCPADLKVINPTKSAAKRNKTVEEETDYSSMHSRTYQKNTNEYGQSFLSSNYNSSNYNFGKKQPNVYSQEENQSQREEDLPYFPSCKEVSSKQQVDRSGQLQTVQNSFRKLKSLGSQNKSKDDVSLLNKSGNNPQHFSSLNIYPLLNQMPQRSQQVSFYFMTPKTSKQGQGHPERPKQQQGNVLLHTTPIQSRPISQNAQSNMFYSDDIYKKHKEPVVSVLHLEEDQFDKEELRDVIDNDIFNSQNYSRLYSPMLSNSDSLKMIPQEAKRLVAFQFSPEHSRQMSLEQMRQLPIPPEFRQTLSQLKRTNTLESFSSQHSEQSCLDMKFMQKNKMRRLISKLLY